MIFYNSIILFYSDKNEYKSSYVTFSLNLKDLNFF